MLVSQQYGNTSFYLFHQQTANEKAGDEGPVLLPNPNGRDNRMKAVKELKVKLSMMDMAEGNTRNFPSKNVFDWNP